MALAGKNGKVTWDTDDYNVVDWKLDLKTDMIDTSMSGSDWKTFLDGQTGVTGSLTVRVDDTAYGDLIAASLPPLSTATIKFYIDATHYFSGTAYLSGLSPSLTASGSVDCAFEVQVTGALSYA